MTRWRKTKKRADNPCCLLAYGLSALRLCVRLSCRYLILSVVVTSRRIHCNIGDNLSINFHIDLIYTVFQFLVMIWLDAVVFQQAFFKRSFSCVISGAVLVRRDIGRTVSVSGWDYLNCSSRVSLSGRGLIAVAGGRNFSAGCEGEQHHCRKNSGDDGFSARGQPAAALAKRAWFKNVFHNNLLLLKK